MNSVSRSPRNENHLISALVSRSNRVSSRSDVNLDQKNVVSWRVPNSPKPHIRSSKRYRNLSNTSGDDLESIEAENTFESSSVNGNDGETSSVGYIEDLKSLSAVSDKTAEEIDFQDRCWSMLYCNIDHAVDELYDLCEEEEDITRCLEAIEMFNQSTRDFTKLIEKIQAQRFYDVSHPSALGWEVRKPRFRKESSITSSQLRKEKKSISQSSQTSKSRDLSLEGKSGHSDAKDKNNKPNDIQSSIPNRRGINVEVTSDTEKVINATMEAINRLDAQFKQFVPKLRPEAVPFIPKQPESSLTPKASDQTGNNPVPISALLSTPKRTTSNETWRKPELLVNVDAISPPTASSTPFATLNAAYTFSPPDIQVAKSSPPVVSTSSDVIGQTKPDGMPTTPVDKIIPGNPDRPNRTPTKGGAPFRVPAPASRMPPIVSPKKASAPPPEVESEADYEVAKEVALASEKVWAEAEAWIEAEAAREDAAWVQLQESSIPSPLRLKFSESIGLVTPQSPSTSSLLRHTLSSENKSSPTLILDDETVETPRSISAENRNMREGTWTPVSHLEGHRSSIMNNGSQSVPNPNHSTPISVYSAGRSLHMKLSTPERKISPTDLKRRTEARLSAAAESRDRSVAEKIVKARKFLTRVDQHRERNAEKLARREQMLEDKLRHASERHGEHLKTVRGKANNENNKVSEVIFINTLNAEDVAEQLQKRLSEAEARILAAAQRREERLAGIANERQRRNSRKTQQMSAMRLAVEKQQMERWSKLQSRLEAVRQRREVRLQELQRRTALQQASPQVDERPQSATLTHQSSSSSITASTSKKFPSDLKLPISANKLIRPSTAPVIITRKKSIKSPKAQVNKEATIEDIFEQNRRDVHLEEIRGLRRHVNTLLSSSLSITGIDTTISEKAFLAMNTSTSKRVAIAAKQAHQDKVDDKITESFFNSDILKFIFATLESSKDPVHSTLFSQNIWLLDENKGSALPQISEFIANYQCNIGTYALSLELEDSSISEECLNIIRICRILLGNEAGALQSKDSWVSAVSSLHWSSPFACNPIRILHVLLKSLTSNPVRQKFVGELMKHGFGPIIVDVVHVLSIQTYDTILSIVSPPATADEFLIANSVNKGGFNSETVKSLAWASWSSQQGQDLYFASILLDVIMTEPQLTNDGKDAFEEERASLRWYFASSGLLGRLTPLLHILKRSCASTCFITSGVLPFLEIYLPGFIPSTLVLGKCDADEDDSTVKRSKSKSKGSNKSLAKVKSKKNDEKRFVRSEQSEPWRLLLMSTMNLISSVISGVYSLDDQTPPPKSLRLKETASLIRTAELPLSLLALLSSLTIEFNKRGDISSIPSNSSSILGSDSTVDDYTWEKVEVLLRFNYNAKAGKSVQNSYRGSILNMIDLAVSCLTEFAEFDSSLISNLPSESISLLALVSGSCIHACLIANSSVSLSPNTSSKQKRQHINSSNSDAASGISTSPRRSKTIGGVFLNLSESCIGNILVLLGKAALRRADVQLALCSPYYSMVSSKSGQSSMSTYQTASSVLDLEALYSSLSYRVNHSDSTLDSWRGQSLLRELCQLPQEYFNDERCKHYLLPTLISMTLDCDSAAVALRSQLTPSILTTYLRKLIRELQEFNQQQPKPKSLPPLLESVSKRLPTELWELALQINAPAIQSSDINPTEV